MGSNNLLNEGGQQTIKQINEDQSDDNINYAGINHSYNSNFG